MVTSETQSYIIFGCVSFAVLGFGVGVVCYIINWNRQKRRHRAMQQMRSQTTAREPTSTVVVPDWICPPVGTTPSLSLPRLPPVPPSSPFRYTRHQSFVKSAQDHLFSLFPRVLFDDLAPEKRDNTLPAAYRPRYTKRRAAVLFADISGFTVVADAMQSKHGDGEGAERLSACLNTYFGMILECVRHHDGDVMLFSGDAVLVCWFAPQEGDDEKFRAACHACVACGAAVSALPPYAAVDKLTLTVHLGASCGDVWTMSCGGHQPSAQGRMKYLVTGEAIAEAGYACNVAGSGTFVLHRCILSQCHFIDYAPIVSEPNCFLFTSCSSKHTPTATVMTSPIPDVTGLDKLLSMFTFEAALRHAIKAMRSGAGELRTVSTVFIKLVQLSNRLDGGTLHAKMQQSYSVIQKLLRRYEGVCNKLMMDDKGVIALCVFGLPGYVHEDDSLRSLRFALKLSAQMKKQLGYVVAVGVSRARVFLGCCGAPSWRHEYTVLSDGVNISARLMGHANEHMEENPVGVVCDAATVNGVAHSDDIDFGDSSHIEVKNKKDPLQIFTPRFIQKKRNRSLSQEGIPGITENEGVKPGDPDPLGDDKSDCGSDISDGYEVGVSPRAHSPSSVKGFGGKPITTPDNKNNPPQSPLARGGARPSALNINTDNKNGSPNTHSKAKVLSQEDNGPPPSPRSMASKAQRHILQTGRSRSDGKREGRSNSVRSNSSIPSPRVAPTLEDDALPELYGRENETATIERLIAPLEKKLNTRNAGHSLFLSILGDSGSGKTSLMLHTIAFLRGKSVPMHVLNGDESLSGSAFGAMKKYLRMLVSHRSIDYNWFLAEFDTEELDLLPTLANLIDIPELTESKSALTAGQSNNLAVVNKLILDIFRHTVTGLYILIVEDMQWLDPLTAAFVMLAVRHKVPTIVFRRDLPRILTYHHENHDVESETTNEKDDFDIHSASSVNSDESINLNHTEIETILSNLRVLCNENASIKIELKALARPAFEKGLYSAVGCTEMENLLVDGVYSRSEGNVGFAREIMRNLIEMDKIRIFGGRAMCVGNLDIGDAVHGMTSIQAVMMKNLDNLSDELQSFLAMCSVLGTRFTKSVLSKCYQVLKDGNLSSDTVRESQVAATVYELVENGLLIALEKTTEQSSDNNTSIINKSERKRSVVSVEAETVYSFKKSLMRDVVYHKMLAAERRHLHSAVATVYSGVSSINTKMETWKLAYHVSRSGDGVRAVSLLQASVQESRAALDPHFSLKHLRDIQAIIVAGPLGQEYVGYSIQRHKRLVLECQCDLMEEAKTMKELLLALEELGQPAGPALLQPSKMGIMMAGVGLSLSNFACCKSKKDNEIALLLLLAAENSVARCDVDCARMCLLRAQTMAEPGDLSADLAITVSVFNYIASHGAASRASLPTLSHLQAIQLNVFTSNYFCLLSQPQNLLADSRATKFRRVTSKFTAGCCEAANLILFANPIHAYRNLDALLKCENLTADRHVNLVKMMHCFALCFYRKDTVSTTLTQQAELTRVIASISIPEESTLRMIWAHAVLEIMSDLRQNITSTLRALTAVVADIAVVSRYPKAIDTLIYVCILEVLFTDFEKFREERTALIKGVMSALVRQGGVHETAKVSVLYWEGMSEYIIKRNKEVGRRKWEECITHAKGSATTTMLDELRARYCRDASENTVDKVKTNSTTEALAKVRSVMRLEVLFSTVV